MLTGSVHSRPPPQDTANPSEPQTTPTAPPEPVECPQYEISPNTSDPLGSEKPHPTLYVHGLLHLAAIE